MPEIWVGPLSDRARCGSRGGASPSCPIVRLLSHSLRLAKRRGSTSTLDDEFGRDLETVVSSHREPLAPPAWD
jgi:hypothetical protein